MEFNMPIEKIEVWSNREPFNTFSLAGGKNSTDSVPLHGAAEPCQGYLWLSFKLFFVLSQFLKGLATTRTYKLYLWVSWGQHYLKFFRYILTGQKRDMTELKSLWLVSMTGHGLKIIWALVVFKSIFNCSHANWCEGHFFIVYSKSVNT